MIFVSYISTFLFYNSLGKYQIQSSEKEQI